MTQPDNPNDFVSPNSQPDQAGTPSGSKALPVVLITAGVGCGCLGLLVFLGIISAIALPSFLNQADKARRFEAESAVQAEMRARKAEVDKLNEPQNYVSVMLGLQQAYMVKHGSFAQTNYLLEIPLPLDTPHYQYKILEKGNIKQNIFITAQPFEPNSKSYIGAAFLIQKNKTIRQICESLKPQVTPPGLPTLSKDKTKIQCAAGSRSLIRN